MNSEVQDQWHVLFLGLLSVCSNQCMLTSPCMVSNYLCINFWSFFIENNVRRDLISKGEYLVKLEILTRTLLTYSVTTYTLSLSLPVQFFTLLVFHFSHILPLPLPTSPSLALYLSCLTPLSHLSISMCQDKLAETHISFSLSPSVFSPLNRRERNREKETEKKEKETDNVWRVGVEEQHASEERRRWWGEEKHLMMKCKDED